MDRTELLERETGLEPATTCLEVKPNEFSFEKTKNRVQDNLILDNFVTTTSLESLARGYILSCRCDGKSDKTLKNYDMVLKKFIWFCRQSEYPEQPQKLNVVHIRQFLWYLSSDNRWANNHPLCHKPASRTTINDYYRALHSFFNWLVREQMIIENPFARLNTPKVEKKVVQALTKHEIELLLDACSEKTTLDARNKAIISLFLDTGLRLSELASLKFQDVDTNTGAIIVRNGKGGKQRIVRIGMKAQKALWKYLTVYRRSESDALFIGRCGKPFDIIGLKILFKRLSDKSGVKVHPHKLRHTFAISFLRAGGDVFSLQYLLGHSTLSMTQRYLQSLNADDAMNAHRKFSPLDNLN